MSDRKRLIPITLLLLASCLPAAAQPLDRDREILRLRAEFDAELVARWDTMLESADSGLGRNYYFTGRYLDALVRMYEATGDAKYIDAVLELAERMIGAAQDRDGDGHPEWYGNEKRPDYISYDVHGAGPIARAVRLCTWQPDLRDRYAKRVRPLHAWIRDHVINKWLHTRGRLAAWRDSIAHDPDYGWREQHAMLVRIMIDSYAVEQVPVWAELARELAQHLVNCTTHDPACDCLTWRVSSATDTTHMNRLPTAVMLLYENGLVIDGLYVQRMCNTLSRRTFDGVGYRNFPEGFNGPVKQRGPYGYGIVHDGWARCWRYDRACFEQGMDVWRRWRAGKGDDPAVRACVMPDSGRLVFPAFLLGALMDNPDWR